MHTDRLASILAGLNSTSSDIEASAIISTGGLTMAAALSAGLDEDRIGAMGAAMLSRGDKTAQELARGDLERVLVKGDKGYVLITYAGKKAILIVMARSEAELEPIFLDAKRTAENIEHLLQHTGRGL